jgi:hypothetical protein
MRSKWPRVFIVMRGKGVLGVERGLWVGGNILNSL